MKWINKKFIYILLIPVFVVTGILFLDINIDEQSGSRYEPGANIVKADSLVNVNTASLEELESLPSIGESRAQAIIDYRDQNGPFTTIEDIMNVYGIGQGTFDNIKDLINVKEVEEIEDVDEQPEEDVDEDTDEIIIAPDSTNDESEQNNYSIYKNKILINEIMFNPIGIDNDFNEWIEIYNNSNNDTYLTNWLLQDNTSKFKFNFKKIPAKGFVIVRQGESELNLNNFGGEKLELFDAQRKIVDIVEYEDEIPQGQSYNWCETEQEWQWLVEQSINNINNCPDLILKPFAYFEISQIDKEILLDAAESYPPAGGEDGEIMSYLWEFENEVKINGAQQKVFVTNEPQIRVELLEDKDINIVLKVVDDKGGIGEYSYNLEFEEKSDQLSAISDQEEDENNRRNEALPRSMAVNLKDIKNLSKGTSVIVEGQVLVEPGTLGATIFYIGNPSAGVQVYSYKKDFPGLVVGDVIQVSGEISEYYNETRIKIKNKNDIYVVESGNLPEVQEIGLECLECLEELEGSFIKVSGEVTSIKYDYFYLDDGNGEIKVTIKETTGIDIKDLGLEIGGQVEITGILSETKSGYRLLPRYKSDLIIKEVRGAKEVKGDKGNKGDLLNYLIAVVVAGIVVVVWLAVKKRY